MDNVFNILIVDDHEMFIDGLSALLSGQDKYQVTATANNGKEALVIIENQKVDLLITDLSMPEMSGTELVKICKEKYPEVKVLVLSMHNNRETVAEILMSEAEGYILKNTGKQELLTALDRITDDGTFYSHEVMSIMFEKIKKDKKRDEAIGNLTERELEVLGLIVKEKSSEEIAQDLFISKRTVDTHRKHIIEKTGVKTIVGLIKYAIFNDIISPDQ